MKNNDIELPILTRSTKLILGLAVLITAIFWVMGSAYSWRLLVESACYAVIALGLTIQWGYAGLFNAGIMGFIAIAAYVSLLLSFPPNLAFWESDSPELLGGLLLHLIVIAIAVFAISQLYYVGLSKFITRSLAILVGLVGYLYIVSALEPIARTVEREAGFIGGFGLPVALGWIGGACAAAILAFFVGRICLGLRSDYLAIATLGIAEIVKAFLKNADWLTRGTLTVSPLPWPTPSTAEIGFAFARATYLALSAVIVVAIYLLLQRAYHAPWGRMIRAIRDNERAAAAMGKNVDARRLDVFILGCALMGIGGAMLITFVGIFDPAGFLPLNHTFLIWVMVIVGGPGNNLGTLIGTVLIYIVWTMSEPASLLLFEWCATYGADWFGWEIPSDLQARALQMRVFIIGLTISLVLRYAPHGLVPERGRQ